MAGPPLLSAEALQAALALRPGWARVEGRAAIAKRFIFPDFVAAFACMVEVAAAAEALGHHPEWTNVYNVLDVVLTTHDAGGLSALDLALADAVDAAAGRLSPRPGSS